MPVTISRQLVLLTAVALVALIAPGRVSAQSDAEEERDAVRNRQTELDDKIDVLQATNAEVAAALDGIAASVSAQQAEVDKANVALAEAEAAATKARAELAKARRDVVVLEEAIAEMAIASYIHQPAGDLVESLTADSLSGVQIRKTYLDARAKRDVDLLDLLEKAEAEAEARNAEVLSAAEAAEAAAEAAEAQLVTLQTRKAEQQALAGDVQSRIDKALSEAAVLADRDGELAAQIQAEQAALIERVPDPPPPEPATEVTAPVAAVVPSSEGGDAPDSSANATTDTTSTTTTTTTPPSPPPSTSSSCETPPLRTVQGVTVHADIADQVDRLLTTAKGSGVNLSGWGYRSCESQVALRRAHCGPTYYDTYEKPSSQCSPPTARPGESMHEKGLAIDFTENGRIITSRSSSGYQWLAANAASYGLYNLPSEPWHWSVNGN